MGDEGEAAQFSVRPAELHRRAVPGKFQTRRRGPVTGHTPFTQGLDTQAAQVRGKPPVIRDQRPFGRPLIQGGGGGRELFEHLEKKGAAARRPVAPGTGVPSGLPTQTPAV